MDDRLQIAVPLQPETFERLFAYLRRQPWEEVHMLLVELSAAARAAVDAKQKPKGR